MAKSKKTKSESHVIAGGERTQTISRLGIVVAVFAFGIVGSILLFRGFAAGTTHSVEPESSQLSGSVAQIADTSASNGKAVVFGAPKVEDPPLPPATAGSGESMPVGDIAGWKQVFTDDFTTDVPRGEWSSPESATVLPSAYTAKWGIYPDGTKDSAGTIEDAPSMYSPSKVISVKDGLLNKYLHAEDGKVLSAAVYPLVENMTAGRLAVRMRTDAVKGYRVSWSLLPVSGVLPKDGTITFPLAQLDDATSASLLHQDAVNDRDRTTFSAGDVAADWHTYVIEWSAEKVNFILDGKIIGTSTERIPNTPMRWVLQTEACTPACYDLTTNGNLQIDWVAVYRKE